MDKKIKKMTKDTEKVVKQEKALLKADKKNDAKMSKCDMKKKKK